MTEVSTGQQQAGQVGLLAALIREVDGDHSLGAAALAEALAARGVRVVPLPVVETDEWGDRIINIPRGNDSSMTGRVRLGQGVNGNQIAITGLPSSLEIEYAPEFAAAFLSAFDSMTESSA